MDRGICYTTFIISSFILNMLSVNKSSYWTLDGKKLKSPRSDKNGIFWLTEFHNYLKEQPWEENVFSRS